MRGEEKDFITVWLTLGQRTLRYETYVLPAPEENEQQVLRALLLRRNDTPRRLPLLDRRSRTRSSCAASSRVAVDDAELDRVLGTLYATVEAELPAAAAARIREQVLTTFGRAFRFADLAHPHGGCPGG